MRIRRCLGQNVCACVAGLAVALGAIDAGAQTTTRDMRQMSLVDLMSLDVTTVSRGPEATARVPAAVHVITQDDIRRSGAVSIPEVLRLAPGMQVPASMPAHGPSGCAGSPIAWRGRCWCSSTVAPSIRNCSRARTGKLQDVLLEDIDRIEVIRGPGGTLWGANAVNGIVNIITKTAKNSQGVLAHLGSGSEEHAFAGFRYGASAGPAWQYRVYGKAFDRASQYHADGSDFDGLRMTQGGFKADWAGNESHAVTIQGDIYDARLGQRPTVTTYVPPYAEVSTIDAPLSGGNVLARWTRPLGNSSGFQLQTFFARTSREEIPVAERRDTFDVDFQQTPPRWRQHQLNWGLGYRVTTDQITAVAPTAFVPPDRSDALYSGFVQDEFGLIPDRVRLTLGSKFEHNAYSGFEVQPGARVLWTPDVNQTMWAAITRAVRTPSRVETDYTTTGLVNAAIPSFVRLMPNADFKPESLVAYEVGYRVRPVSSMYLSFSSFYNQLDDVLSTEILTPFPEPVSSPVRLVIPVMFGNGLHGESYGAEVSADVRATPWWRWTAHYAYVRIQLSKQAGSVDGSQERRNEGLSPRHQIHLQSSVDLAGGWSLDGLARYVSALPAGPVPAYATADVRVATQITPRLELAIVGRISLVHDTSSGQAQRVRT